MDKLKLSAPWVIYYRKLFALFGRDPDISINLIEEEPEVKLYVDNSAKAEALVKLLPTSVEFGNVTLKVTVVPSNGEDWKAEAIATAFEGNPILNEIYTVETPVLSNPICYVCFAKEVVQFFTDDLSDAHGIRSTLYQNLADEVLGSLDGIYFCTETEA